MPVSPAQPDGAAGAAADGVGVAGGAGAPGRPLVLLAAAATTLLLVATSWGYGFHRDELYFVMLGGHPEVSYVDQPPLTPLLDHLVSTLSGGSLVALRLWPALAMGGVVLATAALAGELGAGPRGRLVAAVAMGTGGITLGMGHLASTAAADLLCWALLTLTYLRGVRRGGRWWLAMGAVAALALWTKLLVLTLLAALAVGVLVGGPRRILRDPWLYAGAALGLVGAAPVLWWQWAHGLPQLDMAAAIAAGGSATSTDRWLVIPYQLVLVSPVAVPVWGLGLWRLVRDRALADGRAIGLAWVVALIATVAGGGKPYYLAGFFPALLAAGAEPLATRFARWRTALVACFVINALLFLPLLPPAWLARSPVPAVNPDAPETLGWPAFARTVGAAYDAIPVTEHPTVLAGNYGQAGALHRYRPDIRVASPHNALWSLGPPPDGSSVVAVGVDARELRPLCGGLDEVARIDNGLDLDNEEQGGPVLVCRAPTRSWSQVWPSLRRLG